jgi:protein-disulfide isomerase
MARVDGEPVTRAEVDARAAAALSKVREEEYQARRAALEELLDERILDREARARGITREQLLQKEVDAKVQAPDPKEVALVYERNQMRFGGRSRAEMLPQIERAMRDDGLHGRRQAFVAELKGKANVVVTLSQPRAVVPVPAEARTYGPDDAPVTLVEFSDYLCPYCQRARDTVDEVLKRNPGKVRLVHQDYLLGRPRSLEVARAAQCAGDQGKFWEYRHVLLAPGGGWEDPQLVSHAQTLGLDKDRFARCLSSDKHDADVHAATERGRQLGVHPTPTFFITGRRLPGARPIEQFQEIIDSELRGKTGD